MPWSSTRRRDELPSNWEALRRQVLTRDGSRCTWDEFIEGQRVRCAEPATDVDHVGDKDDHGLDNLRSLCGPHHDRKTAFQGWRARQQAIAASKRRFRRDNTHPAYRYGDQL